MTKRIIGLFLALCLVVGLLPMIALAEETGTETPPPPPAPATLTITTGTNDAPIQWTPELSAGMTPAYAKTTAEGALVLEGASEAAYNLKVEWAADGKPTLTLNGATLANDTNGIATESAVCHTIVIGGTEDFVVLLKGTNTIKGAHGPANTQSAAHRMPAGFRASNKGSLTIKSLDKATDTLLIDNFGGYGIWKEYADLLIESANIAIDMRQTGKNGQTAIQLSYVSAGNEDNTNLTIKGSTVNIKGVGKYYGNVAIAMGETGGYKATNTGDILFQNSVLNFNRNNGSSVNSTGGELIKYGDKSTCTIDRCDVALYGSHRTFRYAPTIINCKDVQQRDGWSTWSEYTFTPGQSITANTNNSALKATHICISSAADDFDCTTATACDVCGKAMSTAQTAHTPKADDGDCTTEVVCANEGCKKVITPAKAAHTPAADDGDCTTAVKCTVCGKETTPAKAAHTGGTATCTAKAKCTTCGKEYGELAAHKPAARPSCDVAANCTVCGQEVLKAGQHKGGTATCQAKAKCTECGKEYGELGAHKGGTATCKDKAKCTVCGKEYGELSTAHVPAADDGDCTTAIKCSICGTTTTAAKTHTGGTATCKAKAKCATCGKEYGELGACTPAADDGDCTTAIKCSVCGKETTAAKTAHTFADDKDASCDNAGCKHTRTLTTNPSTGDISILLTAAVALTSAVGFAGVTVLRKKEN